MTGNKNAWRAPLAGLASVAMIATMGVAAATANAASDLTPNENDQYFGVAVYRKDQPWKAVKQYGFNYVYGQTFDLSKVANPYSALNDGKVLTGYSYDLAGKNVAKPGFAVKGDTKLYAQYADAVNVTFKGASFGGADKTIEIAKGSGVTAADYAAVTEPTAPAGEVFAGWKLTDDKDAEDLYTGEALNSDTILYPVFRVYSSEENQNNASQVFFDVPDNTTDDATLYTLDGKPFPAYRAPAGTWLDASGNSYDFSAPIDSDANVAYNPSNNGEGADLILTAATAASDKSWTVNYDFGKPNGTKVDPTNDVAGSDVFNTDGDQVSGEYLAADDKAEQPADPAVKNAVFTGWYDAAGNKVDFNVPVSQQPAADTEHRFLEVHAGWDTKNVAAVVYYYNYKEQGWSLPIVGEAAGRVTPKTGKALDYVTTGNAISQPTGVEDYFQTAADKDHGTYTSRKVVAWQSVADGAVVTKLTASTAVYAKWDSAASIFVNGNGGSFSNGNNGIYATKTDSQRWQDVVETPTRAGYTFTFWTNADKTLRANLFDGYYYDAAGKKVSLIADGSEILANWVENNQDKLGSQIYQYNLSFTSKSFDVAKLVKEGYTKASATKFVDEMYKLEDEYQAYLRLTDAQEKKDAAAKLTVKIAAAEKLLVRQDAAEVPAGTEPVYRAYNPYMKVGSTHLFTTDEQEYKAAKDAGWIGEGIAFYTTTSKDAQKVYRLYNKYDGSHHYTTDKAERDNLLEVGWTDEGVAWYAASDAPDSVYRAYNKYNGEHLFTLDADEMKNIVSVGWIDEGVAFKATAAE
ncbi:InlB B-repeat-containing protein [Bifidobacterium oedipodis]|uniref:Cell wall surface anchor family protein n=1 Tax=Bifidobacterium oedipodis TaxID=2675322 RepID=A0A7Y0ERC3_9BIFI|nr:InlB B-repeat-containing protein [Bifidobacterium sp. DSM 109957]NMM95007.1 Cell wall surface anchor family protein [Bifidobacterium sp. DSM 109957]